jgi:tetratricopeptide (TPR) repeat protein
VARARAKDFYRRTLELNPRHASSLSNLGVLALEEGFFEAAEKFFASSIEAEPDDAKTFYLLARARFEAGKTDTAKSALSQALEMRPHQREFLELRDKLAKPPGAAVPPPAEPPGP